MYSYTWYQWLCFFYLYCFFGWIFESGYVSLKKRTPVNRGFLRIPLLPLYGSGAVMMLWVSIPFQDNLFLTWLSGFIGATVLEYVTGAVMERLFKVRYWDYSDQPFNINGYVCLGSSIVWGFLTIFMTHGIHRPIERAILAGTPSIQIVLVLFITVIFIGDAIVCVREALAFGSSLEKLKKLREETDAFRDELHLQAGLLRMEVRDRLEERIAEREEQISILLAQRARFTKKLLHANPSAASRRYKGELESLREFIRSSDFIRSNRK